MQSQGGWGGSAHYPDPTAQSASQNAAAARTHGDVVPGPAPGPVGPFCRPSQPKEGKRGDLVVSEVSRLCLIRCADVAVVQGPGGPCPPPRRRSATLGWGPNGPVPRAWATQRRGGLCPGWTTWASRRTLRLGPRLALANGLASHALGPLRMASAICFAGGALPMLRVPPIARKAALRVPSLRISLSHHRA